MKGLAQRLKISLLTIFTTYVSDQQVDSSLWLQHVFLQTTQFGGKNMSHNKTSWVFISLFLHMFF
jgi:hypothetical protein